MKIEPPRPTTQSVRFEQNDVLKIRRLAAVDGTFTFLNGVFLRDDGGLVELREQLTNANNSTVVENNYNMAAGYLLSLSINTLPTATPTNEFAVCSRIRGSVDQINNRLDFCSGYVAYPGGLSYPDTGLDDITTVNPLVNVGTWAGGNVGVEVNWTAINAAYGKLIGFAGQFVADATVAVRVVRFNFDNLNGTFARFQDRTQITAGQTVELYGWLGPNLPADQPDAHYFAIPDNAVSNNLTVTTVTTNLQAGDQFMDIDFQYVARPNVNNF